MQPPQAWVRLPPLPGGATGDRGGRGHNPNKVPPEDCKEAGGGTEGRAHGGSQVRDEVEERQGPKARQVRAPWP